MTNALWDFKCCVLNEKSSGVRKPRIFILCVFFFAGGAKKNTQ
jgi:hypothetical protein